MLRAKLMTLTGVSGLEFSETPVIAKVQWEVSSSVQTAVQDALGLLDSISPRDEYELLLDAGEERMSVTRLHPSSNLELSRVSSAASLIDAISVSLIIRKKVVDHRESIYFFDRLGEYFDKTPLLDAIGVLAEHLQEWLQFEVFEPVQSFGTTCIGFSSAGTITTVMPDVSKAKKLEEIRNNSSATGIPSGVLPSDFFLLSRSSIATYNRFFDEASAVLSLAFIANTSELSKPNLLSYKLYGYKAVMSANVPASGLVGALKQLYEIFAWSYEGGSAADKLGLVRNVVSLHLDASGQPQFDDFVIDAIHSNYQIYLKGNIQTYLEVKNKLADLLLESVERTSRLADDVFESFKNNVFVIATFLLTVVVINGLKDTSVATIFSGPYFFLVCFLAVCSGLWLSLIRGDVFSRYQDSKDAMEGVLRTNYEKFLLKAEVDASLQPTLTRNTTNLEARIRKYSVWWVTMLVFFVGFFAAGYFLYARESGSEGKVAPSSHVGCEAAAVASPAGKPLEECTKDKNNSQEALPDAPGLIRGAPAKATMEEKKLVTPSSHNSSSGAGALLLPGSAPATGR